MLGLSSMPREIDAGEAEFLEHGLQRLAGHFVAALDGVIARLAVGRHFGLDHRHDAGFLAEDGVAGQHVGIGADVVARSARSW